MAHCPSASTHIFISWLCEKLLWSKDSVAQKYKMLGLRDLQGHLHFIFIILQNQKNVDIVDFRC